MSSTLVIESPPYEAILARLRGAFPEGLAASFPQKGDSDE